MKTLDLLLLSPACDGTDVGEALHAYHWVSELARRHNVTLLTMVKRGRIAPSAQLPGVKVIEWRDLPLAHRHERLNSMLKPGYVKYYWRARRWIRQALREGQRFDLVHQLNPIALRYPSPASGLGIPLVIGPLAGSLDTPPGFQHECRNAPWFTRLRGIDRLRLKHDPVLRQSFSASDAVIGVAPYVAELLEDITLSRFEVMSELGIDDLAEHRPARHHAGSIRIAHVGRVIRTKGLRDVIRALARVPDELEVVLESAGDGEDLQACRQEAEELGVAHRVRFHGRIPRADVEQIYRRADAFVFPSFREPSGGVIFESMRHGLPVVTTTLGGPAHVVDESCGIKVPAAGPEDLASNLATAITRLASDPTLRTRLAAGARQRMAEIGIWQRKIDWLDNLYGEILYSR